MTVKNISIMEDAYNLLLSRRRKGESFSDVIRNVLSSKKSILHLAGAWKNVSNKETDKMKEGIMSLRKRSTKELVTS